MEEDGRGWKVEEEEEKDVRGRKSNGRQ